MNKIAAWSIACAALVSTSIGASSAHAATTPTCHTSKTTAIVSSDTGGLDSNPSVQTYIWTNAGHSSVPAGTSWPFVVSLSSSDAKIAVPGLTFSDVDGIVSAKAFTKTVSSVNPNDPRQRVHYARTATERFTLKHALAPGEQIRLDVSATGIDPSVSLGGVVHGSSSVVNSSVNTCDTVNTRVTVSPSYLG